MTARYLALYERLRRPRRRSQPRPIEASVLTSDEQLAEISTEWGALCDRCPTATPFQRPEWLRAWRRQFGVGGASRVLALTCGGRLVGVLPLEVRDGVLRWIGAGISDYLDAILEPGVQLAAQFPLASAGCRAVELEALRPGSPVLALARAGELAPGTPSPVVELRSRRSPPRLAYEQRRLARAGSVSWEDQVGDPLRLLDGLFALHRERWSSRGEPGVLATPGIEQFHRDAALALHARGVLRIFGLQLDRRLIAVLYGFLDHGRFLFYLSGFSPELASFSPGRLLIARAMEHAADEGAIEFDFLRGREGYKYEWGAVDRPASIYQARLQEDTCSASGGR